MIYGGLCLSQGDIFYRSGRLGDHWMGSLAVAFLLFWVVGVALQNVVMLINPMLPTVGAISVSMGFRMSKAQVGVLLFILVAVCTAAFTLGWKKQPGQKSLRLLPQKTP